MFAREPLAVEEGIQLFSHKDEYTRNYERIAGDHLQSLRETGTNPWIPEALWVELEQTTIDLIVRYSRPRQSILDVGVGLGRTLAHFPSLDRYGMDISLGYLAEARAKGIQVCYARIEDMPYKPDTFDLVVCTDVLEHVLDLNLCCRKILSVLKPGGILIVRAPVHENLMPYLAPDFPYEYVHLRTFDEASLQLLFGRIMQCHCLELVPAGYSPSRDRLRRLMPLGREVSYVLRAVYSLLALRTMLTPLIRGLYHPIDMNIVVRKPELPASGVTSQ